MAVIAANAFAPLQRHC